MLIDRRPLKNLKKEGSASRSVAGLPLEANAPVDTIRSTPTADLIFLEIKLK